MDSQEIEVVVGGRLGPDLVAALDGFAVTTDGAGRTHVVGSIPDQSRLFGLLEMFESLHIEVISVNPTSSPRA